MAWIRRVRTKSGATAVQIAESVGGRRRIVRHVGSAHDEAELGLLIGQAERLLADDLQGELDLWMEIPQRARPMVPAPPVRALIPDPSRPGTVKAKVVGRGRVVRAFSGVLYETLAGVYDELGFDAVGDEHFRDLVIARIVEPTSLLDVDRVLADLGRKAASHTTRKRTLRRARPAPTAIRSRPPVSSTPVAPGMSLWCCMT
ncbi:hypothetical protein L2W11_10990 [Sediminivirga luteola]|nr:hypothetical protein [Sediminivirga luteola]MCI2266029.1 hypothetical protein [Sediminivirga luteola]